MGSPRYHEREVEGQREGKDKNLSKVAAEEGGMEYESGSPDEEALVNGAAVGTPTSY
jgi:hypothetical protein